MRRIWCAALISMLCGPALAVGQIGPGVHEGYVNGKLTSCALEFQTRQVIGDFDLYVDEGFPVVQLTFIPDLDKPAAAPLNAWLLDGGETNESDRMAVTPAGASPGGSSFAFKIGDRTAGVVAHMIETRKLRFSYVPDVGIAAVEADVTLSVEEAARFRDCVATLLPGSRLVS